MKFLQAIPDTSLNVQLNHKQQLTKDTVHDYVRKVVAATSEGGEWPEALRMFLCGPPGTGKSTATKAMTNTLSSILG